MKMKIKMKAMMEIILRIQMLGSLLAMQPMDSIKSRLV